MWGIDNMVSTWFTGLTIPHQRHITASVVLIQFQDKVYSTVHSQVVTHPSANTPKPCNYSYPNSYPKTIRSLEIRVSVCLCPHLMLNLVVNPGLTPNHNFDTFLWVTFSPFNELIWWP